MTIEKWVKEEKMRLGRFEIYCVNAQKKAAKSFPLKMPRSCWSGQYRSWDDSLDALSIRLMPSATCKCGREINSAVSKTGTPNPLANPTNATQRGKNPTLFVA